MKQETNKTKIFNLLERICNDQIDNNELVGVTTEFLAHNLKMQRSNVSSILNELYEEGKIDKTKGKPVHYVLDTTIKKRRNLVAHSSFDNLVGSDTSLKSCIDKAKAAMLYPPNGLHTLLLGPTGVGKTMFAELMHTFALENDIYTKDSPFVSFNCADDTNNTQLLFSHLFGSQKGSYTGATEDKLGIVEKARNGILFLDEIHRLPPEGQEMLFNLIDKGIYRPLGGIEDIVNNNILIICATTENEDSVLLSTFKRRIPMLIALPSLKERTLDERIQLICEFFRIEANRTGRGIIVLPDVMRSLVLYNCSGNIGQLKSDLQLACANAFLRCITFNNEYIQLELVDLPDYIKKGIMNYKQFKGIIDVLVPLDTKFSFTSKNIEKIKDIGIDLLPSDFYENIEKRILELKKRNVDEKDINLIMSMDIDNYFKTYIYKLNNEINKKEMSGIIDDKMISLVEIFLNFAGKKLNRLFPQRIFFSLCLHMEAVINRIKKGNTIINYTLNETIEKYPDEYGISMYFSDLIERDYGIKLPVDEIGYISMFINKDFVNERDYDNNPVVLIAMHGVSTASSMADVVNKLVGADNTYAFDLPLEKSVVEAYEELIALITQIDRGGGVILLLDMGSIGMLGEVISNETKIRIRVIEMATTVLGIECSRKAMAGSNIDVICNEIVNLNADFINYSSNAYKMIETDNDNIIITLCLTGEGSAVKLKNLIEDNIELNEKNIQIVPMSITAKNEMEVKINKIAKNKNILGIVGTINPEIHGIPFISATEIILDKNYHKIKQIVNSSINQINVVIDSLANEIKTYDVLEIKPILINLIHELNEEFINKMSFDSTVGLIFHICYSIEKKINHEMISEFKYYKQIIEKYRFEVDKIEKCFEPIQKKFNFKFSYNELSAIFYFLEGYKLEEPID